MTTFSVPFFRALGLSSALCLCFAQAGLAQAPNELEGTWVSGCSVSPQKIIKGSMRFSGSRVDGDAYAYADDKCATPVAVSRFQGVFSLGRHPAAASGIKTMVIRVSRFDVTPASADAAELMNSARICGIATWAANKPANVLGLNCGTFGHPPAPNGLIYNIYRSNASQLTLGSLDEPHNGLTPQLMPSPQQLDVAGTLVKTRR